MAQKNGKAPKPESLRKEQFLEYWAAMQMDQKIKPTPVPYKHSGSTYAEDGIRLTGSRAFVDQVLSHLKGLLIHENGMTRLQVVYKQSVDRESGYPIDSWNCYIQVHQRGREAQMVNMYMDAMTGRHQNVKSMIYLHLATKNDGNGNPRRLFLVLSDTGDPIDAIDEGYAGTSQVRKEYPDAVAGPRIEVAISEYRDWLRWAKERNI